MGDEQYLLQTERAVHYAISRIQSFSGSRSTWAYLISPQKFSGKWLPFLKRAELINTRLKKVQIECLDFEKIIEKYDTKNTLFYVDPPYIGGEKYYNTQEVNFTSDDHERLSRILKKIKGMFVLSYYDHDIVRILYKGFNKTIKFVPKYSVGNFKRDLKQHKPIGRELLIKNY
ncbi:MAG: DNA adenine methylase [Ignavibacteriaceae bacterium]